MPNPLLQRILCNTFMAPSRSLCAFVIVFSSLSCDILLSFQEKPPHQALFVFGDSLFDPGNNHYLDTSLRDPRTHWPYGETYFKHPTGRFSDGRVVPDFIAQFAKLPILPPYLQPGAHELSDGANFASGGAAVLNQNNPRTIDLPKQLSYFKAAVNSLEQKKGDSEAKMVLSNAVYLFSIGGNDYFILYSQNPNITKSYQAQYVRTVIRNLTNSLKEIYSLGGRKIAYQNVYPLGCSPMSRASNAQAGGDCVETLLALARQHNAALSAALSKKLEKKLPGFKYSIFDAYNSVLDKINNPSKYEFKEGKVACCGSGAYRGSDTCAGGSNGTEKFQLCSKPSEYVWFDYAHTTERANRQLAELIWNGPPNITGPYTVKQLFESA